MYKRQLLTDEIADYEYLDWKPMVFTNYKSEKKVQAAVHNALIEETVQLTDKCYVENSWLRGNTVLEKDVYKRQLLHSSKENEIPVVRGI